jgi:hypothetical protein
MTQKEIAIQCLEKLNIYKPYIRRFKSKAGTPCFFENFGGFYADQEEELWAKIKEVEKDYDVLVYAITHEFLEFGECWAMLCVNKDCEEPSECLDMYTANSYYAFAYVWNETEPMFSEFGDVLVRSFGGGIRRVG